MLYDYQYDIMGLVAVTFLLILYSVRRNYRSRSNFFLLGMIVFNLLACVGDLFSCFAISFPQRYPMFFNYLVSIVYLFFYNMLSVLYLLYVDSRAKIPAFEKPCQTICIGVTAAYFVLIVPTAWTHLAFYYDENMQYRHGPAMPFLYVITLVMAGISIAVFIKGRKRFNLYQVVSVICFIMVMMFCVFFQAIFPRYLIGQFCCTMVLFLIYAAFENPAYYNYRDTRCLNRSSFVETLKRVRTNHIFSTALIYRVDDFREMRKTMRHRNSDVLSKRIAEFNYQTFGAKGYCLDDDLFVVFLEGRGSKNRQHWNEAFDQIHEYFSHPVMLWDEEINVSYHTWIVTGLEEMSGEKKVEVNDVCDAIVLLTEDPSRKKGEVVYFKDMLVPLVRRQRIISVLKDAIANEGFDVYYQPILDVEENRFRSAEALVRLRNRAMGYISPEEFIPIAEEHGLIGKIGETVFKQVCRFINDSNCVKRYGIHYIEINLSPLQCAKPNLVSKFAKIMDDFLVIPEQINLEITETASFSESSQMSLNIHRFSEMGVTFSLDDYGSGFASIDYLFKLPVSLVKIDKSILWGAMKDKNAMIIMENTMDMLKKVGKKIVVEGVETQEMVEVLRKNGCDYMQGYFYSKPLPEDEFKRFMRSHVAEIARNSRV